MVIAKAQVEISMSEADAKALLKFLGSRTKQHEQAAELRDDQAMAVNELYVRLREIFEDGVDR